MKKRALIFLFLLLLPDIVLAQGAGPCYQNLPIIGVPCNEQWNCGPWTGTCSSISDSLIRSCRDLANCGTEYSVKPDERKSCAFNLSCVDLDGDGFGLNCFKTVNGSVIPRENDCNDRNSNIHLEMIEVCDGVDNNCDGNIDVECSCIDGDIQNCGSTFGGGSYGVQVCISGKWSFCGGPGYKPVGINKTVAGGDCNVGETRQCGATDVGVCDFGLQQCPDGKWTPCIGEKQANPEVAGNCYDNLDNDCDGLIDSQDPNCATPGDSKNEKFILCTNGQKDNKEEGVDCGGICDNACSVDLDTEKIDSDYDEWEDNYEEIKGTNPLKKDTDEDGLIDSVDSFPLCPNNSCDSSYGETEENCPQDCKKNSKLILWVFLIVFILLLLAVLFLVFKKFKKLKKEQQKKKEPEKKEAEKPKERYPGFKLPSFSLPIKKEYKTEVEKELEKEIKELEK